MEGRTRVQQVKFSCPKELGVKLAEQAQGTGCRASSRESRGPAPLSPLVLALTMAGGLWSLRGGCSALGASVRNEIHRWDAESGSPTGFYGAPLSRQEGPRGQSRPGDSHSHFPPPAAGEEAGATAARVAASGATHTPILGSPLCEEKGTSKSEHPLEPSLLLPVESRCQRERDKAGTA